MIDDLTSLFGRDDPESGFRQGTIISFNVLSGLGDVRVGGATLTDVPFLTQAGQVSYLPGDAVLLIRFRSSWAILGRYVSPGGIAAIGRYFELTGVYSTPTVSNYSLTTTFVTQATMTIGVPPWAEVATVTASLMLLARNSTASTDFLQGRILPPSGGATSWISAAVPTLQFGSLTVVGSHQMLVTPGGSLVIGGQVSTSGGSWAANVSNAAYLQATVAWNSNDGP